METNLSLTRDMKNTIKSVIDTAESSDEGSVFFVQLSHHPVVSLYISTGKFKDESETKRCIHMKYVYEEDTYPVFDLHNNTPESIGFQKYNLLDLNEELLLSFPEYKIKFYNVCDDLNSAIAKYNGIMCFEDGNKLNSTGRNVIILHVCDIMNLMICKKENRNCNLFLKSNILDTIDNRLKNSIDMDYIREDCRVFFWSHIDFFYTCYGYLANTSFIPIRTTVKLGCDTFKESSFFTNNDHFNNHQKGKLMQFNQSEDKVITRIIYRSI